MCVEGQQNKYLKVRCLLASMSVSAMAKYEELNADVFEKEVDDGEYILQDLVGDGELTENDLLEIAFNDIGVDGLKKYILK